MTYPPPGNSDPYGQPQQPPSQDPFASPPPAYGQPAFGEQPPAATPNPYDPYAQQPPAAPQSPAYGQQSPAAPQNPYDPYAQQQSPAPQYGQPYAAPQYPAYGAPMGGPAKKNGMAIGAMATGIASIPLACCAFLGIIAGIVAIVLGIVANKQIAQRGEDGKGFALTGLICGGVGLLLGIVNAIVGVAMNLT
ncbi:MAG: DUF4190 domain-containing protein [Hamadaea sp.]|uniref:DUF4190 domain-containing protein n=1 Tax=Hamadaea sp. TaxID=2024425 RepID=UPI0017DBA6EB|nr:DUF4190 domain-containing protein [Hamadaea sp.]NUR71257.1 DUF4190 domain-containing protein [Hamadaea sp.]NUT23139.1 DUF4190 domain-containing protein [Hamadaea sp.]